MKFSKLKSIFTLSTMIYGSLNALALTDTTAGPVKSEIPPIHLIVDVHGLRGDAKAFGDFPELVKKHLIKIDQAYQIEVVSVGFDIKKHDFDQFTVRNEINQQIDAVVEGVLHNGKQGLRPQDKMSILLYSMGGNVGLPWLTENAKNPVTREKYLSHLRNFMGLGAPYWGSAEAGITSMALDESTSIKLAVDALLNADPIKGIAKVNLAQVETLAVSGMHVERMRNDFIDFLKNPTNSEILKRVKFTNVIGLLPCTNISDKAENTETFNVEADLGFGSKKYYFDFLSDCKGQTDITRKLNNLLTTFTAGAERRETDGAVVSTSATLDFAHSIDGKTYSFTGPSIPQLENRYLEISHATVAADKWDDYVVIKKEFCDDEKVLTTECNRFYKYLLYYLASNKARAREIADPNSFLNQLFEKNSKIEGENITKTFNDDKARSKVIRTFMLDFVFKVPDSLKELVADNGPVSLSTLGTIIVPPYAEVYNKALPADANSFDILYAAGNIFASGAKENEDAYVDPKVDGKLVLNNLPKFQIQLARKLQLGSRILRVNKERSEIRVSLSGRFLESEDVTPEQFMEMTKDGYRLPDIQIKFPHAKKLVINPVVKPGVSTYTELNLETAK